MRKYDHLRKRLAGLESNLPDREYERRWKAVMDAIQAEAETEDDGSGVAWRLNEAMNHFSEWVEKHGH